MARLVLIHGAFNELWGPNELRARWAPALRDGLWHHGVTLDDADIEVCFYGDLFRAQPGIEDDQALDAARRLVSEQFDHIEGPVLAKLDAEVAKGFHERTIDLAARLVADATLADRVVQRLADSITDDTRVVVAHSLGTIVSNRALCANPDWPVEMLVTLGSPLGSSMVPVAPGSGPPAWPDGIARWVNVAAVGDKAANPPRLSEVIDPRIEDHLISNGRRAHDPEPYLNASITGQAVAEGLGLI